MMKATKTVKNNYSEEKLIEMLKHFDKNKIKLEYIKGRGFFVTNNDIIYILHNNMFDKKDINSKKTSSRNAFLAQNLSSVIPIIFSKKYNKIRLLFNKNIEKKEVNTDYNVLIFRMLKTLGVDITTIPWHEEIKAIKKIDEILYEKQDNLSKKNNSPSQYIMRNNKLYVYGKFYGAAAGEVALILQTIRALEKDLEIFLYIKEETKSTNNTQISKQLKEHFKTMKISVLDNVLVKKASVATQEVFNQIRNQARFEKNLIKKFGEKKCYICNIAIKKMIISSHINAIHRIKKEKQTDKKKIENAISGENGLFLCRNHDILFERGDFGFDISGAIIVKKWLKNEKIYETFLNKKIQKKHLNKKLKENLKKHREHNNIN